MVIDVLKQCNGNAVFGKCKVTRTRKCRTFLDGDANEPLGLGM
jgi:hypothetical protein